VSQLEISMSSLLPAFESDVLTYLRSLADPCKPPIGAGTFLLLYASRDEVVVWFEPASDHQRAPGEVLIPAAMLADAWEQLVTGRSLDLQALAQIAGGAAGAHWLLALLALLPNVGFSAKPPAVSLAPAKGRARAGGREKPSPR
jgi:hypothetical protein